MKNMIKTLKRATTLYIGVIIASYLTSCDFGFELPEAGSKADTSPPEAGFSYSLDPVDFTIVNFTDLSSESTTYLWDFDGEATSTEKDPTHQFAGGEGTYTVTLVSSDGLGVTSTATQEVVVVPGPYQPIILEPGFEDGQLEGDTGDGRDSWRNGDLGGVIQITSSPVVSGDQAAKLTGSPADQRIGYQEIIVEAETSYSVNFIYTIVESPVGYVTVDILDASGGTIASQADAANLVLGSATVNNQEDAELYESASVAFNSGSSTLVAIYFHNEGSAEARLDDFTIDIAPAAAIPPAPSFTVEQSDVDYLEYAFINSSVNATDYSWDFGDGNISTEESPIHVYAVAGVYSVSLTATSSETGLSADFTTSIDIQAPVTADFTYAVDAGNYQKYAFVDTSEGAVSLMWDFGDGFQSDLESPSHTYADDGIYTVTLTAMSVTGLQHVKTEMITVAEGFVVQVLNGTFDEYTVNTGDNADAWDMTPNSTVVDNDGNTIDSPYDPLWDNGALDSWLDTFYSDNSEQAGSTSDGNNGTRGAKLDEKGRRLYQVVQVQVGETYTFSIDAMTTAAGITSEVFILNTEIADETGINASTSDAAVDAYFAIPNIFATDGNAYATSTFDFTASTNQIVIYVRNVDVIDNTAEAFFDNIEITDK